MGLPLSGTAWNLGGFLQFDDRIIYAFIIYLIFIK